MRDIQKSILSVGLQQAALKHDAIARALRAANDSVLRGGEPVPVSIGVRDTTRALVGALTEWATEQALPSSATPDPEHPDRLRVWSWAEQEGPDHPLWCVVLLRTDDTMPPEMAHVIELARAIPSVLAPLVKKAREEVASGSDGDDDDNTYVCELCGELRTWGTEAGGDGEWPVSFTMADPSDAEIGQEGCCCRACAEALRIQIDEVAKQLGPTVVPMDVIHEAGEPPSEASYRCGLCGELRKVVDLGGDEFSWYWWPQPLTVYNVESAEAEHPYYAQTHICRPCTAVLST